MRVLVIGGAGFLGSHIVDRFLRERNEVTVFDLHPEQFRRSPREVAFFQGDFGNVGTLDKLIRTGFDVVVHCVSTTTPKTSNESPVFDVQSNIIGSLHLLDICVERKVSKLVFLSSGGTIYGDIGSLHSVNESHPANPVCAYAVSKLAIEHFLGVYKHLHGLDYVVLRVSNPYGERQNPMRALGALTVFLYRTIKRQEIEVWGDGTVIRDFIYVGDVANAVYLATVNPTVGIFNVGSGIGFSLRDVLRNIFEVVGLEPSVTWLPSRTFDVPRIVLDATKLRTATGWQCLTSLSQGIALTAEWLRKTDFGLCR
jgi:UDP-glucose 4-epimerase